MKLFKPFAAIAVAIKPPKAINPAKLEKTKAKLAQMDEKALRSVLNKEIGRTEDFMAKLGLRKEVSTTMQAFTELHTHGTYVRNGALHSHTVYRDPFRNASAFIRKRSGYQGIPISPTHETLRDVNTTSININAWRAGVTAAPPRSSALTFAYPARDAVPAPVFSSFGNGPILKPSGSATTVAAPVSLTSAASQVSTVRSMSFGSAEAPVSSSPTPLPLTPALSAQSSRTDSMASASTISRGGLNFSVNEPISVATLASKLTKVNGKKAER